MSDKPASSGDAQAVTAANPSTSVQNNTQTATDAINRFAARNAAIGKVILPTIRRYSDLADAKTDARPDGKSDEPPAKRSRLSKQPVINPPITQAGVITSQTLSTIVTTDSSSPTTNAREADQAPALTELARTISDDDFKFLDNSEFDSQPVQSSSQSSSQPAQSVSQPSSQSVSQPSSQSVSQAAQSLPYPPPWRKVGRRAPAPASTPTHVHTASCMQQPYSIINPPFAGGSQASSLYPASREYCQHFPHFTAAIEARLKLTDLRQELHRIFELISMSSTNTNMLLLARMRLLHTIDALYKKQMRPMSATAPPLSAMVGLESLTYERMPQPNDGIN